VKEIVTHNSKKFVKPKGFKSEDFTRGHGDVLKESGVIRK